MTSLKSYLNAPKFVILVTTDGSRPEELSRFLQTVHGRPDVLIALLFQNNFLEKSLGIELNGENSVIYAIEGRLPLSQARNYLLDRLATENGKRFDLSSSVLLLADDDCWYAEEFFECANFSCKDISLFAAIDPDNGRSFSTFDLRKRNRGGRIRRWEIMFYGVSIAIAIPYSLAKGHRFHRHLGLGNVVSQGEESYFLIDILRAHPDAHIHGRPDLVVYHPHKLATTSKNHHALGYFLGWAMRKKHFSVMAFYFYLVSKYAAVSVIRPKQLYWSILFGLLDGFCRGTVDTMKLDSVTARKCD